MVSTLTCNQKLVSVAMATYNGSRFIEEQLESILNQTYEKLEIIIVDDCSTDDTMEIIQRYSLKDSRIQFHKNNENIGFVKNFQKAISLTTGDYIALCDQDDVWNLKKIELFVNEIKDNLLIYSNAQYIDAESNLINNAVVEEDKKRLMKGNCNRYFVLDNCVSGNALMFKKELLDHILPIPPTFSYHDIWIAFIASTVGTIVYTDQIMTNYRRYIGQVTLGTDKVYRSFFDRLGQKRDNHLSVAERRVIDATLLKELSCIDNVTETYLDLIIDHYSNFKKGIFNFKLYNYLKKHSTELLSEIDEKQRSKRARMIARKLKFHSFTLFIT